MEVIRLRIRSTEYSYSLVYNNIDPQDYYFLKKFVRIVIKSSSSKIIISIHAKCSYLENHNLKVLLLEIMASALSLLWLYVLAHEQSASCKQNLEFHMSLKKPHRKYVAFQSLLMANESHIAKPKRP